MQTRDLSDFRRYVPGRGPEEVARERGLDPEDVITLSSNENALGPPEAAIEAVVEGSSTIHRYPKASHVDLTEAIADRWNVSPDQIWLANGGDGALDYLSRAFLDPGSTVLVPIPGFAYYGMSARYNHGEVETYDITTEDGFDLSADRVLKSYAGERIIYLTTPHNPTGAWLTLNEIERIAAESNDDTLIVVDEAYGEFSQTDSAITLVRNRDDVVVLRSFSKAYGLAGLRLGYLVVPREWATAYERVNTPFATNELACLAGQAALESADYLEQTIQMARDGREYLREHLTAKTWPSEGNFVLTSVGDAAAVADALLDRGVIVRDCSSFGLDDCLRITTAPKQDLQRAVRECNDIIDRHSEP